MVNISSLLRFARFKYKLLFEKQSKWMSGASVNTLTEMALPEHDVPMCEWKSKNQRIWKANINQNICIFRSSVVWLPRTRNFVNCYCLQISEAHLAGKKEKFPSSHDELVHICRQRNNCVINRNFVYTCKSFIFRQRARERERKEIGIAIKNSFAEVENIRRHLIFGLSWTTHKKRICICGKQSIFD